jgi:hypothetical protein
MTDDEKKDELRARWFAAMHAVQSGVAMEMNFNPGPTEPKHLRTGINAVMSDHGALVGLLVAKGAITDLEYMEAIAKNAEQEKATYEARLTEQFGRKITLG